MPGHRLLVLVVNDDEAVRDATHFQLRIQNVEVHGHAGGASVFKDRDLTRAGCLILKDRMPCMDGFEVIKCLRALNFQIPVILLTGEASAGLRARADAAGVCLVLENPILDNALVDGVLDILRGQRT
ncbi:MAG: response regulator [Acidiphilium sp.]|nr:response regulator [Acidiphilium sp.]